MSALLFYVALLCVSSQAFGVDLIPPKTVKHNKPEIRAHSSLVLDVPLGGVEPLAPYPTSNSDSAQPVPLIENARELSSASLETLPDLLLSTREISETSKFSYEYTSGIPLLGLEIEKPHLQKGVFVNSLSLNSPSLQLPCIKIDMHPAKKRLPEQEISGDFKELKIQTPSLKKQISQNNFSPKIRGNLSLARSVYSSHPQVEMHKKKLSSQPSYWIAAASSRREGSLTKKKSRPLFLPERESVALLIEESPSSLLVVSPSMPQTPQAAFYMSENDAITLTMLDTTFSEHQKPQWFAFSIECSPEEFQKRKYLITEDRNFYAAYPRSEIFTSPSPIIKHDPLFFPPDLDVSRDIALETEDHSRFEILPLEASQSREKKPFDMVASLGPIIPKIPLAQFHKIKKKSKGISPEKHRKNVKTMPIEPREVARLDNLAPSKSSKFLISDEFQTLKIFAKFLPQHIASKAPLENPLKSDFIPLPPPQAFAFSKNPLHTFLPQREGITDLLPFIARLPKNLLPHSEESELTFDIPQEKFLKIAPFHTYFSHEKMLLALVSPLKPPSLFVEKDHPIVMLERGETSYALSREFSKPQSLKINPPELASSQVVPSSLPRLPLGDIALALPSNLKGLSPKSSELPTTLPIACQTLIHPPLDPAQPGAESYKPQALFTPRLPTAMHLSLPMKKALAFSVKSHSIQPNKTLYLDSFNPQNPHLVLTTLDAKSRRINHQIRKTTAFMRTLPSLDALKTYTFSQEFDIRVKTKACDDGNGYLFALEMQPREEIPVEPIAQNFLFVIDRSYSIQKHRFNLFKKSVHRALTYLKEGDSFNIVFADRKTTSLSESSLPVSRQSILKAKRFLEQETYLSLFSPHDGIRLMDKIESITEKEALPSSVIYISDGSTLKSIQKNRSPLLRLLTDQKPHFTLYTAAASHGNNLAMLHLISTLNKGELMYSPTNASFPRRLCLLIKHIDSQIVNDLHLETLGSENNVELFAKNAHFFTDRAQTIYGKVDKLEDFDLILQGKLGDEWINVRKRITFEGAEKGNQELAKWWAIHEAQKHYKSFIHSAEIAHLSKAKSLLEPFDIAMPIR